MYWILLILLPTLYILHLHYKTTKRVNELKSLNPNLKMVWQWVATTSFLGNVPWVPIKMKRGWQWELKYGIFKDSFKDSFAFITPHTQTIHISDPDLVKEVTTRRGEFPKPTFYYRILDVFGQNVVTLENDAWRRHRKIISPQFSERNNQLVHDQTIRTVLSMFSSWSSTSPSTTSEISIHVGKEMMKLALFVISGAGFGKELVWDEEEERKGGRMGYKEALEVVVKYVGLYLILPRWVFRWVPSGRLRGIREGFDEFVLYMREMIEHAKEQTEGKGTLQQQSNIIRSLVSAIQAPDSSGGSGDEKDVAGTLSDSELLGNVFILLFAGHETTAGTLTYALTLLALHPEVQEELYEEVKRVVGDGKPAYKHFSDLVYTQAIMNETLRLFPPVIAIPKWTGDTAQQLGPFHLPPRTHVDIDVVALHRNPKHWGPDPDTFRPSRFLGQWNRQALVAFSEGPRACLGKKFAQVEFVCALAMLSLGWRWRAGGGEGMEMLESSNLITLKPKRDPVLKFSRREG